MGHAFFVDGSNLRTFQKLVKQIKLVNRTSKDDFGRVGRKELQAGVGQIPMLQSCIKAIGWTEDSTADAVHVNVGAAGIEGHGDVDGLVLRQRDVGNLPVATGACGITVRVADKNFVLNLHQLKVVARATQRVRQIVGQEGGKHLGAKRENGLVVRRRRRRRQSGRNPQRNGQSRWIRIVEVLLEATESGLAFQIRRGRLFGGIIDTHSTRYIARQKLRSRGSEISREGRICQGMHSAIEIAACERVAFER